MTIRAVTREDGTTGYACARGHVHENATGAALCDLGETDVDREDVASLMAARAIASVLAERRDDPAELETAIAGALDGMARSAALAERKREREACAELAEGMGPAFRAREKGKKMERDGAREMAEMIAAAIRARAS